MHLGRGYEKRQLYQSVLLKLVVFSVLVLALPFLEEFVKRVIAGKPFGTVWHNLQMEDMVARTSSARLFPCLRSGSFAGYWVRRSSTQCCGVAEWPTVRSLLRLDSSCR